MAGDNMVNDLWNRFVKSGRVEDYLKYKFDENKKADITNADNNQGLNNQGTEYRGE